MNRLSLRRPVAGVLLLTAVVGAAGAGSRAPGATASPSVAAPFDRQFIDMMVPHHQGAVAMAQIAGKRGQHNQVKAMARAIINGQQKEIAQMKAWRKAWYGSSTTPTMEHMPMLPGLPMRDMQMNMAGDIKHLRTARPFDKAFINAMIPHHQSAVDAAQLELKRGSHAQLKALARKVISAQQREIRQLKRWRTAWYGNGMGGMPGMR